MDSPLKRTSVRYSIIAMLFLVSTLSYGDRVAFSIAGISIGKDLHLAPLKMGYLLSSFSWAYVAGQLPAGALLDRYGCRRIYGLSIVCWSLSAFLVGFAGYLSASLAFGFIVTLRLLSGLAQAPVFPGNGRVVAAWFPAAERGRASATFNASQYFAVVVFAPSMGWMTQVFGWRYCFWTLGVIGIVLTVAWFKNLCDVEDHPRINEAEVQYIEEGGGFGSISGTTARHSSILAFSGTTVGKLLRNRMLIGIYLGQFGINTITWFFLTWFPIYLSQARHMSIMKAGLFAALPSLCGSIGGILGGFVSDTLLSAGHTLSFARKLPIIVGMLLSMTMMVCNYVTAQWMVILFMSMAFFGKGIAALGWTIISDTSPKGMVGLNGGLFNFIGNLAAVTTPIAIGYLVQKTGSFHDAILFVAGAAILAILGFVPIAGTIRRLEPSDLSSPVLAG